MKVSVEGVLCSRAKEVCRIEMMLGATTHEVELSTIKVRSIEGSEEVI